MGISADTWLNLQKHYELEMAMEKAGAKIRRQTSRIEYRQEIYA